MTKISIPETPFSIIIHIRRLNVNLSSNAILRRELGCQLKFSTFLVLSLTLLLRRKQVYLFYLNHITSDPPAQLRGCAFLGRERLAFTWVFSNLDFVFHWMTTST